MGARAKTVCQLCLIVVGMFGFGFALVPLYDLLCEVTGLGGRTGDQYVADPAALAIDPERTVGVRFMADTNAGMPWRFWSEVGGMRVHPGEMHEVTFFVTNTTDRPMTGQAVPSVSPGLAAEYFHKTECFCFTEQVMEAGEKREMKVRFVVNTDLPRRFSALTLSYTFFAIPNQGELADRNDRLANTSI